MLGDALRTAMSRARSWSDATVALRVLAWGVLVGATGFLVRAEVEHPRLPEGVVIYTDLVYRRDGDRRVRLDVYTPTEATPEGGRPAVLAIHGGGWRGGSKRALAPLAATLAQRGYVVVAVDYLLSKPGVPSWPTNVADVREAVRWLRRHADDYGVDPDRIAALGTSAGGHLAALLGTLPEGPIAVDEPPSSTSAPDSSASDGVSARVQAVIDFYGPSDLAALAAQQPRAGGAVTLFLGGERGTIPGRHEAASPVRHVTPDDPPMLLIHGDDDLLVPIDQSRRLASALDAAGVRHRLIVVGGARHGFEFRAGSRDLLPEILAFLDSAWDAASGAGARESRPG